MAKPKNKPTKKKMGAPTKYKEEFCEELISFFDVESFTVEGGKTIPGKFPTVARFALNIGVHVTTLHDWATAKDKKGNIKLPDFSYAYKTAKLYQEAYLYEAGLVGAIDRTFGIWATKTILGHKEPEREPEGGNDMADVLSKLIDKLPN